MSLISVRIPQMGEGLQEARLVEYLKRPGDRVRRDEPIYVMETDKAVTEVESPYEGTLVEWLVEADSILPIGTEIARMEVGAAEVIDDTGTATGHGAGHAGIAKGNEAGTGVGKTGEEGQANAGTPTERVRSTPHLTGNRGVPIPPRTRKYLRELGLIGKAPQIPAVGKKLLPTDVDRFVAANQLVAGDPGRIPDPTSEAGRELSPSGTSPSGTSPSGTEGGGYDEAPLPKTQQNLNYRMYRGAQACIAAVIEVDADWTRIAAAREALRHENNATGFALTLWCVSQVMRNFPLLRSTLASDGKTLRTYRQVNLGVAVAVENGLLRTAVVRNADSLPLSIFIPTLQTQIERVRQGEDQIDATTTVTVSNIGSAGVRSGVPVIVTPAVATIALGRVVWSPSPLPQGGIQFRQVANLTMTFDHRIVNGVGAAEFLMAVKERMEQLSVPA